jgi:lipid A ethanolaminephosphotransferase
MSCCNVIIYNVPVILFTANNLDYLSLNGVLIIATVVIVIFIVTSLFLLVLCILSFNLAKLFCLLVALCNSIALYFVITYRVVLDTTMMSNVFNTNLTEASSYWHYKMILYLIMLGVIPSIFIYKFRINKVKRINLFLQSFVLIVVLISWTYLNANKLLWIDKYSSRLGARIVPWSYIGNTIRLQQLKHKYSSNQELLPPAQLEESDEKTITILVIGEAARAENFSLYGYNRPTNPLLEKQGVIALDNTVSCATYTTLSLRCILSHKDVSTPFSKQYEPLPSYLQRHGVDVVWRTNNWGEPPMKVNTYQRSDELERECKGDQCQHDEVLLSGLGERVRSSMQQNIFIVIHLWGSHGP